MAVDDIEKLRPELLKSSIAELERKQAEIALAIAHKHREEEVKAKQSLADEINRHIEMASEGIKFLKANGQLPERITEAFSRSGTFSPAMFLKRVQPEDLISADLRPKRRRRTKAEIDALKASGQYKARRR